MKRTFLALVAVAMLSSYAGAASTGDFGAGVILGSPTGVTAKYWLDQTLAIDGGIGFGHAAVFYADLLFNSWDLFPAVKEGKLDAYVGAGPRVATDDDGQFALRTVAGAAFWPTKAPIELFAEIGPTFKLTPDNNVDIDGGIGLRFYFTAASKR